MSRFDRLHVYPNLHAELGKSHVKIFHTNIYFVQRCGESSPR
jgi:hypothetical protein